MIGVSASAGFLVRLSRMMSTIPPKTGGLADFRKVTVVLSNKHFS
jgi:hypothetical protein